MKKLQNWEARLVEGSSVGLNNRISVVTLLEWPETFKEYRVWGRAQELDRNKEEQCVV